MMLWLFAFQYWSLEDLLEVVFIEGDGEHDEDPGDHAGHLQQQGHPVQHLQKGLQIFLLLCI